MSQKQDAQTAAWHDLALLACTQRQKNRTSIVFAGFGNLPAGLITPKLRARVFGVRATDHRHRNLSVSLASARG
jgi:hypothetical protein